MWTMSQLSSCYFCGTALDAPVEESRLVPAEVHPVETGTTISLCPTCRTKLSNVLETTLSAVEAGGSAPASEEQTTDTGGQQENTADTKDGEPAETAAGQPDDPTAEQPDDPAADTATDQPEDSADAEEFEEWDRPAAENGEDSPDGASASEADEEVGEEEPADTTARTDAEPEPDEDASAGSGASAAERAEQADPDGASDSTANRSTDAGEKRESSEGLRSGSDRHPAEGQAAGGRRHEGQPDDQSRGGGGPSSGSGAGGGAGDPSSGGETPEVLTRATGKKVIRLLQNREFPVEREEFQLVASNAYDIPHRECIDVVDALIDQDFLDERNGQLHRPEE
jgi:hypothetical protein